MLWMKEDPTAPGLAKALDLHNAAELASQQKQHPAVVEAAQNLLRLLQ